MNGGLVKFRLSLEPEVVLVRVPPALQKRLDRMKGIVKQMELGGVCSWGQAL